MARCAARRAIPPPHAAQVHKGLLDEIPGQPGYIVAIKSIKAGALWERDGMLREAALMAQFEHPFVTKLVGVVTVGEPLLVVLEYCEHGALRNYLQTQEVPLKIKLQFAGDCAEGLEYLSKHNFVHRDIAARNVLVSSERRCKISDFGLSRETFDKEYYRSSNLQIAVRWTAPEALEERIFSQQSDCWSFGVMLWEIWCKAETPYGEWNHSKVWSEVVGGFRLPCPSGCPVEIHGLMQKCWFVKGFRPQFQELATTLRTMEVYGNDECVVPTDGLVAHKSGIYVEPDFDEGVIQTSGESAQSKTDSATSRHLPSQETSASHRQNGANRCSFALHLCAS